MKKMISIIIVVLLVLIAVNAHAAKISSPTPFKPTNNTDIHLGDIRVNGDVVSCSANLLNIKLTEQKVRTYATYSLYAPRVLDAAAAIVVPIPDQENKKIEKIIPPQNEKSGKISFNVDLGDKKILPKIYVLIGVYAYAKNPLDPDSWNISFDFAFASVLCISNQLKIQNKISASTGEVYYKINWGDGKYSLIGPYKLGTTIRMSHHWKKSGTYYVNVKIIGRIPGVSGKWFPLIKIKIDDKDSKKDENIKQHRVQPNHMKYLLDKPIKLQAVGISHLLYDHLQKGN